MDPTFDNLPYQIPGPAGGTLSQIPSQLPLPPKSSITRLFQTSPWQAALRHLQAPPHGSTLLSSSIALLHSHALSDRFKRLSNLPVLLDALSWVGRDASVTLRDPTGSIRATVHAEVFSKHKTGIEIGAALLLSGVAAVAYLERRPIGFRRDEGESLHVSIQGCHVIKLFPVGCMRVSAIPHDPKQSYRQDVRKPLVVRRPPTRRQPSLAMSPPQRLPLRQRAEPQQAKRPISVGGNFAHRGGFQPHGQQRRPLPPVHGQYNAGEKRPYAFASGISAAGGRGMMHVRRPGMQSTVRRPGMQPLSKRPASARNLEAMPAVQVAQTEGRAGIGTLTDEQLDSLLGDVDIDAVIAASGKGTAQVKAVGIGESTGVERAGEKYAVVGREQGGGDSDNVIGGGRSRGDELKNTTADEEQDALPQAMERAMGTAEAEMSAEDGIRSATAHVGLPRAQVMGNEQRTLSKADEAMIDSLLEGLDGSDF